MIKAVIFDCFGVLATDGWLAYRQKYLDADPDKRERADKINRLVDTASITWHEFAQEVAKLAGVSEQEASKLIEKRTPNEELFDYIANTLKPRYKIGMLSNVSGNFLHEMFTNEQVDLFDATTFSYELGVAKPDARMYETIATRLDVLPEECVFIDDQQRYVMGAKDVGMQGIHYVDLATALRDLEEVLNA